MSNTTLDKAYEDTKTQIATLGRELKIAGHVKSDPAVLYFSDQEHECIFKKRITGKLKTEVETLIKAIPPDEKLVNIQKAVTEFEGDNDSTGINKYLIKKGYMTAEEVVAWQGGNRIPSNSRDIDLINYEIFRLILDVDKTSEAKDIDPDKILYGCIISLNADQGILVNEDVLDFWDDQNILMIREQVSSFRQKVGI